MKELIFGLTDKINTPYFYDSQLIVTNLFNPIELTHKPPTIHTFLTPNDCKILDGSDPEAGLDHLYVAEGANLLPYDVPREFGIEEVELQEHVVLLLMHLKADV